MENVRNIIESLLFVSDAPLSIDKLKTVLETVDAKEIRNHLNALADRYEARGGGFRLCEVAGGWQLRSRPEYHEYIKRMLQPAPQRLSRAALETLAIVAYNQPIIRADIEHIRGVDCGGMLRQLLERKLIRVLGRKEIPGRPLIYATTKLFLELFELRNLKDLPTPKEIEEMGTDPSDTDSRPIDALVKSSTVPPSRPPVQPPASVSPLDSKPRSSYRHPSSKLTTWPKTAEIPATQSEESTPIASGPHKITGTPSIISPTGVYTPGKHRALSRQTTPAGKKPIADKDKE